MSCLVVSSSLQTPCYIRSHLGAVLLAAALFITLQIVTPVLIFVLLTRTLGERQTGGLIGSLRARFKLLRGASVDADASGAFNVKGLTRVHVAAAVPGEAECDPPSRSAGG